MIVRLVRVRDIPLKEGVALTVVAVVTISESWMLSSKQASDEKKQKMGCP